jgi:hypothetical protein
MFLGSPIRTRTFLVPKLINAAIGDLRKCR